MRFIGWVTDATGKVIGTLWASTGYPGCCIAAVGFLFFCLCIWGNVVGGIALTLQAILPESLNALPVAIKINSGEAPVGIEATAHKCESNEGCVLSSLDSDDLTVQEGQTYLEIWLENQADLGSLASFYPTKAYYANRADLEISCITYRGKQEPLTEPGLSDKLMCTSYNPLDELDERVCVEVTYSEQVKLNPWSNDLPMTTIVCTDITQ